MKQFSLKLLSFLTIFIIFVSIGIFISYTSINSSHFLKLSDKKNIIVLGHSHPECAFNDSLIPTVSNFGASGEAYFYTYLKGKKIIHNNKQIKVVLIEFENTQIDKVMDSWTWDNEHIYNSFARYYPFMEYSDFKFLWEKNSNAILECPPKSFIKELGKNFLSAFILRKSIISNNRFGGYLYLDRDKTDSLINDKPVNNLNSRYKTKPELSEANINYLSKIIEFCEINNVKVFLIRSPIHHKYPGYVNETKFKELRDTRFSKIEFLDFKDFPLENYEFGDLGHLNHIGARVFSIFFNNLLDKNLLNKNNKQDFINNEIYKLSFSKHLNNANTKNIMVK
jgi:hypothetical protein